jgi:hypothetical protein
MEERGRWWVFAGEIERRGEDIAGIAVHIGARVAALAGPDEALVSGPSHRWWLAPVSNSRTTASTNSRACPAPGRLFAVKA